MELHIVSIFGVIFVTLLSLHFVTTKIFRRKKLNLPPGPKPWPVIGNLNLLGSVPLQTLDQLSKIYGPIMQLKVGSVPVVVASSAEAAKIFLKTMDLNFASRPRTSAGKYMAYNYSNILWSPCGPHFSQARKLCSTELFGPKRLDSYAYIRAEEQNSMLKEVFGSAGKPIPVKAVLSTLSSNVISRMVFGKKCLDGGHGVSAAEFKEMEDEMLLLNAAVNVGDYIPWIHFLDLQGYIRRMKIVSKKMDRFLENVLAEHEAARRRDAQAPAERRDVVDVLLEVAENPNLEVKLERRGIKGIALDMVVGGTDTSAVVVEWAMAELLKNPNFLKKATEELDRVIGRGKWVKETDITNLPYIDAIFKETIRLHPVIPILFPRFAREDCQVARYDIEKGTQVFINVHTLHRDPSIWENPAEFNPERFIGNNINIAGQDFRLLPFGSGRRICPGYALGLKTVLSALANLLHGFDWKLANNMKPEDFDIDEYFELYGQKRLPFFVVADPKLPLHLYNALDGQIYRNGGIPSIPYRKSFPQSLKKLRMSVSTYDSRYYWEDILDKIGALPLLQKLALRRGEFKKGKWETSEGQFRSLKYLSLEWCDGLQVWTSEASHFPRLELLLLSRLDLQEIPSDFADISTLSLIDMYYCRDSAIESAKSILEEQETSYGEEDTTLQVRVSLWHKNDPALESLTSLNFHVG